MKVYVARKALLFVGFVFLSIFPAFGDTLDENKAIIERLNKAVGEHKCPAELDYQRDLPPLCDQCPKKNGMVEQDCDKQFWVCHNMRGERLKANVTYNAFLDAECTPAAKDRKAAKEAAAAKERARQINEQKMQRDSLLAQSTSCHTSKELCISACSDERKRNGRDTTSCNMNCKEGSFTQYCYRKEGSN